MSNKLGKKWSGEYLGSIFYNFNVQEIFILLWLINLILLSHQKELEDYINFKSLSFIGLGFFLVKIKENQTFCLG